MRHTVDVAEFHDAVRQQPQRPLRVALGRLGAAQRHQARLELAVGLAHVAGTATLPATERRLHALLDETLLDPIHLARTDAQDLGNGLPARPVLVELALTTLRCFVRSTRAGATAITAAAVTVMTVGGAALVIDHAWLVDQRDVLKTAADAAGIAATLEMNRQLDKDPTVSDADLQIVLKAVAERYVVLNLQHLPQDRLARAVSTLVVAVVLHRAPDTVDVSAEADLGGTLLSQNMPFFDSSDTSQRVRVVSQTEKIVNPIEVVLAIDVSTSMWDLLDGRHSCTDSDVKRGCPADDGRENARISIVRSAAKDLVAILGPSAETRVAVGVVPWHTLVRLAPEAIADWAREDWADYPTRRVYGEPYVCKGSNCSPPASVEQALAPTAPGSWKGCLDSHRMGSVGTRASLPAASEFFTAPSSNAFAQAFFPAQQGGAYECLTHPLPADFGSNTCYHGMMYGNWGPTGYPPQDAQFGCTDDNPVILPLSTDAEVIGKAIDALVPIGNRTYSALGLLWGQRLLDHAWRTVWGGTVHPVDPAARDSAGLRKVLVLLTDGEDTYCGRGNESCADSRVGLSRADACTKVKEAGTEIFVIAAMHPDKVSDALGTSLRACSSESADSDDVYAFLDNSSKEDLKGAFSAIADQLQVVRRVY